MRSLVNRLWVVVVVALAVVPTSALALAQGAAASEFEEGSVALTLEYGGTVKVCEVPLVIAEGSTPRLQQVLENAETSSSPVECVTSFSALSPNLPVEQINGAGGEWTTSINGGTAVVARLAQPVALGDSIVLTN